MKPRLLDLFCGAGGAAMGYSRAGFEVVGVDIAPQKNYPFEFHQADAMTYPLEGFDAIHASPPCQAFTAYRRKGHGVGDGYPDLIAPVRSRLLASGLGFVIENVPRAPLCAPVTLCGSSFGLDVRRHRLFESSVAVLERPCSHAWQTPRFAPASNRANQRSTVEIGVWRIPLAIQQAAMGIDWMTLEELSEAVPPAYTEFIGRQLLAFLVTVEVQDGAIECSSCGVVYAREDIAHDNGWDRHPEWVIGPAEYLRDQHRRSHEVQS